MEFIEDCTKNEKQNEYMGIEWLPVYQLFILIVAWLTGSCDSHYLCSASQESIVLYIVSSDKSQNSKFEAVSVDYVWLLHHGKVEKSYIQTLGSWESSVFYKILEKKHIYLPAGWSQKSLQMRHTLSFEETLSIAFTVTNLP